MRNSIYKLLLAAVLAGAFFTGCRKWDDHNAVTDPALTKNLYQQISENPSLSTFAGLLVKSGYDKVIASSRTFTVFAPSNAALAGLDAGIVNDSARLRAFVENHITTQSYYTTRAADTMRLQMLNGKYQNFRNKTVAEATIIEADKQAKNGVVQVIDKPLPVVRNAWETIENDPNIPAAQKAYLLSLFGKVEDLTNAVQIGVNPTTGLPIYQPGTDSITTNRFWRSVYDLKDESKQYTLFVLDDAAWASEVNKFRPYFATGTADSTTNLSNWNVVKDLALEGIYTPGTTTDTVVSKFGVKMAVDPSAIVRTIKTSNGVIYVMNKMDVQPRHKLPSFVIEAESYRATSHDRRGNTYFRDRYNPLTGKDFRDVLFYGHGVNAFNVNYRLNAVPSGKYRAYWVAANDFLAAGFNQKLAIGSTTSTTFPYTAVPFNNFAEVYIGEFTLATYQNVLDIYLVAAASTTATVNPIVCDYIRLEPVF